MAAYFADVAEVEEVKELFLSSNTSQRNKIILGGGSNILFTKDIDGIAIKINIKGISIIKEDNDHVWVKAGAGEQWHDLVLWCIDKLGGATNIINELKLVKN